MAAHVCAELSRRPREEDGLCEKIRARRGADGFGSHPRRRPATFAQIARAWNIEIPSPYARCKPRLRSGSRTRALIAADSRFESDERVDGRSSERGILLSDYARRIPFPNPFSLSLDSSRLNYINYTNRNLRVHACLRCKHARP